MTIQQKVEELCKDFLLRNGANFTSIRRSGRIGWEDILPKGAAYSEAMLCVKTKEELHKVAYSHARDMIIAMNTPFKVEICLTNGGSSTNHKVVNVATDMFDDPSLTPSQIIDIFTGLTIHEGCHLLYTDMGLKATSKNRIIADLFNILEDERIEMLCGEERPGFANFLGCTKYYYFDKYSSRVQNMQDSGKLEKVARLLNCILAMIRYPKGLDMNDITEFADTLLKVKNVIIPFPSTCKGALDTAEKIYEIIKDFFDTQEKEKSSLPRNKSSKSNQRKNLNDALDDILKSMEQEVVQQPNSKLSYDRMSEEVSENGQRLGKALEGKIELGINKYVNIHQPRGNQQAYNESLTRVKRFIPAIANILRSNGTESRMELRGLRSGFLDTNKLAEAFQGVENIYQQYTVVRADKLAVCILVDESGSMDGDKINSARDTAVLLNEALASVKNVDLYIYGHTTENGNFIKLNAYREGKTIKDKYAIGSIASDWSNIDSFAIREAAARIRARTNDKCLFFVISDGEPCEPLKNVKNAVSDLAKDNFSVISIGIDFEYDPSLMYEHHVSMTDMSKLAPELGKMIKKSIMSNSKNR